MAKNFQTSFYRMGTDSMRMVYVNFHNSICLSDFSEGVGGGGVSEGYPLSSNSTGTAGNFQMPLLGW